MAKTKSSKAKTKSSKAKKAVKKPAARVRAKKIGGATSAPKRAVAKAAPAPSAARDKYSQTGAPWWKAHL